jgi:ATP-binding cassette subfamily B multidrug efflux pump
MLKILKNLKKTWIYVVIIVLLLIVQAICDLRLPDYTSKIVNIGIQQGGIENSSPEVIRKQAMEDLLLFTEDDEKILENYSLISKESLDEKDYEKYLKDYPEIENQELYVQDKLDNDTQEELNSIMAKPLLIVYNLNNGEEAENIKIQILSNMPEAMQEQLKDESTLEIMKMVMAQNANNTENDPMSQVNEKVSEMPESIIEQAAIEAIKQEYQAVGINLDDYKTHFIIVSGAQMLGISLIIMVSAITIMLLSSKVAARLAQTLREKIFKKVLSFSTSEFKKFSTASLITRSTNDVQQIQMLMTMLFRVVVYAPIIGVGGFFMVLANSNMSMAWIIGLAVVAVIIVMGTLFIIAMPKFKKLQQLVDKLNLVSREILTGLPVIRAFNKEKDEVDRFNNANKDLMKANIFVNRAMSLMMPTLMFIMNCISLLIVWVGGHNIDAGTMQVGDMMAFIQYTMQIIMSFLMIAMMSILLPRASVSAKRINEILETDNSIKDPENPKKLDTNKKGLVEFKNVSFRYPDAEENMINNISFTAEPGKTTAIIGSTGSGKSTVINLIPRFYDVTEGELLVDGVNVKDVTQSDLRKVIGFVPQKGILFSGTIESNIKYSDESMSDDMMKTAAEIAQATEFIDSKEKKYNSEIAQGGSNVSGGQKQRLSIARAIAKDPEIFIFDDSFSALDYKTDATLREALKEKTENKTVIIVAQRINTILNADQIIVLNNGNIVGKGTHEELMESCEEYKEIALSQLSEEELKKKGGE